MLGGSQLDSYLLRFEEEEGEEEHGSRNDVKDKYLSNFHICKKCNSNKQSQQKNGSLLHVLQFGALLQIQKLIRFFIRGFAFDVRQQYQKNLENTFMSIDFLWPIYSSSSISRSSNNSQKCKS